MSRQKDQLEDDLYAILNLSKDCSEAELKAAYRRACMYYHPDKHQDPQLKKLAEDMFPKVQTAYSILNDAEKRLIYDIYGMDGVQAGSELSLYGNKVTELKAEFERLKKHREEERWLSLAHPQTEMVVHVDASPLFMDEEDAEEMELEISKMTLRQSVEMPLSKHNIFVVKGELSTHKDSGVGTLVTAFRHEISETADIEAGVQYGSVPGIILDGSFALDQDTKMKIHSSLVSSHNFILPTITPSIHRRISPAFDMSASWELGINTNMRTTALYHTSDGGMALQASAQLGVFTSHVSVTMLRKLSPDTRFHISAELNLTGGKIKYGVDHQLDEKSSVGISLKVDAEQGVVLKLSYHRFTQNYSVPIQLSLDLSPQIVFFGTVIPMLVIGVANKFVFGPLLAKDKERDAEEQRRNNRQYYETKKREANAAVTLMRETIDRKIQEEEESNGLIIVEAFYGRLLADESNSRQMQDAENVIDVRVQLQTLVKDSKLRLQETSKSMLLGFYDPCVGEEKKLYVKYLFRGVLHEVTTADMQRLTIPVSTHKMAHQ